MQQKFQPIKGTRDFYPKEMAVRQWLFAKMRQTAERHGYQETDGPYIEPFALYAAKSGDELVNEQTFHMTDRGGRKIALRPELTPTVARMIALRSREIPKPIRWFSIGPAWRYEQPQKGRGREFFQWEVNIFNADTPTADAEVLVLAASFLQSVGLSPKEVKLKVNDRELMEKKLTKLGVAKIKFSEMLRVIDKKDKMPREKFSAWLTDIGLSNAQQQDLDKLLTMKKAPSDGWLADVLATVNDMGFGDWVVYDPSIARGLDYYTRTVFEAHDVKGSFRAIFGGGRFDNLVEAVGGKEKIDGVGFAIGDMVLTLLLEQDNKIPDLPISPTRILVTIFDQSLQQASIRLTTTLRKHKINAELYPLPVKLDKQLAYADKLNIPFVAIIGPREQKENTVTLKDLKKKTQQTITLSKLLNLLSS